VEIHSRLLSLKELNIGQHICNLYQVDETDLEMLSEIETALREFSQPSQGVHDGD